MYDYELFCLAFGWGDLSRPQAVMLNSVKHVPFITKARSQNFCMQHTRMHSSISSTGPNALYFPACLPPRSVTSYDITFDLHISLCL